MVDGELTPRFFLAVRILDFSEGKKVPNLPFASFSSFLSASPLPPTLLQTLFPTSRPYFLFHLYSRLALYHTVLNQWFSAALRYAILSLSEFFYLSILFTDTNTRM